MTAQVTHRKPKKMKTTIQKANPTKTRKKTTSLLKKKNNK